MGSGRKATFIRDVSRFFTRGAAMYRLSPPLVNKRIDTIGAEYDEVTDHVVVCTTRTLTGALTTYVLRCDSTSYVQSWNQLNPKTRGSASDADVLKAIGYTIEGKGSGR